MSTPNRKLSHNSDATGTRIVKRGVTIEFRITKIRATVIRVRSGKFWTLECDLLGNLRPSFTKCKDVFVVA